MDLKDADEQDVFEIVDYTTASEWERFTASVEEVLHEWNLAGGVINNISHKTYLPPGEISNTSWQEKATTIKFSDFVFKVTHHFMIRNDVESTCKDNQDQDAEENFPHCLQDVMDYKNDFPGRAHCLVRWFGVREFVTFVPAVSTQTIYSLSRVKVVLSSLWIAANNTNCHIPLFLQSLDLSDKMYSGVSFGNGVRTDYEMIHLRGVPPQCTNLSGLLDILKNKLGSTVTLAAVLVSIRFTYILSEWPHTAWMQQPPDFDSALDTIGFSDLGKLPFGALSDPISELQVSATWPCMNEHALVDGEIYSELNPLSAPMWSARLGTSLLPPCLLSEHLSEFLQISRSEHSIIRILGPDFDPEINDGANILNAFNRLTSSPVPSLSSVISRGRSSSTPNKKSLKGPISETVMAMLLNFIFPDETLEEATPYPICFSQVPTWAPPPSTSFNDEHPLKTILTNMKTCSVDSFVWRLSVVLCHTCHSLGGLAAAAHLYYEILMELRFRWDNGILIPGLPDGPPDLASCLVHQKLQMLNCCIQKREARECDQREQAEEELEDEEEFFECNDGDDDMENEDSSRDSCSSGLSWNKPVGRRKRFGNKKLLNRNEYLYVPLTQEAAPITEDKLEEQTEEFLRLGSDLSASQLRARMMSSALHSDMESFKAANPGALLEDFVRWYSPRDWVHEDDNDASANSSSNISSSKKGGKLSARMQIPGNLWREVWENAKPVPARRQKRLFDDTREAQNVLHWFFTMSPGGIYQDLLSVMLHIALARVSEEHILYTLPAAKSDTTLPHLLHSNTLAAQLEVLAQRAVRLPRQPCDISKYQYVFDQLGTIESAISKAQSLRMKVLGHKEVSGSSFTPAMLEKLRTSVLKDPNMEVVPTQEKIETDPIENLVSQLLDCPEVVLDGGPSGKQAEVIKTLFSDALKANNHEEYPTSDSQTSMRAASHSVRNSILGKPTGREYILRTHKAFPSEKSKEMPQRLYAVILPNDFRMTGVISQDTIFC